MNHLLGRSNPPNCMDTTPDIVTKHSRPIQGVGSNVVAERHAEVWKDGEVRWLTENRLLGVRFDDAAPHSRRIFAYVAPFLFLSLIALMVYACL